MIIKYFTDNDLYKFSVMYAIQRLYPWSYVKYEFINRGDTCFPEGFAARLKEELVNMESLKMTKAEKRFMEKKCYFFDPVFIDFLEGYRYDSSEVSVSLSEEGKLSISIEGYWYRTVLWEVPLMAIISELYFQMTATTPTDIEARAIPKAKKLAEIGADYSEFGTRRRFSFEVQDRVISCLKSNSGQFFKGTSNLYLAMLHNTTPIGTMPHEWFMYHGALYGYRAANMKALEAWVEVFGGSLGITLTDTYTTDSFFESFSLKQAKLFDGLRCDSGDPIAFIDKTLDFYKQNRIETESKTVVFSDSLNLEAVKRIKNHVSNRLHDTYGIGTFFSNDVGATPLNMVIKLTNVKSSPKGEFHQAVKLSDVMGKNTGNHKEIAIAKMTLGLDD